MLTVKPDPYSYTDSMTSFSEQLKQLLNSNKPITVQALINSFGEKSFAVLFLVLLAIPALPLPTGGVTHVLEIIAMLLASELMAGRRTVWLPNRWLNKKLPDSLQFSALPKLVSFINRVERLSHPRLVKLQNNKLFTSFIGGTILIFSLVAFFAPPFSGLDTLPALGVVVMSLGIIFEDFIINLVGLIIGGIGTGLVLLMGGLVYHLI